MDIVTLDQHINKATFDLGRTLFKHTPIIIDRGSPGKLISSSLLLKYESNYFLAMAAHTLKSNDLRNLGFVFDNTFMGIGGQHAFSNPREIQNDKIDVAVVRLEDAFVKNLPEDQFDFFELKRLNIDHRDIEGSNYLLFGYPLNRSKVKISKRKIRIEPFNYRTNVISEQKLYAKLGIHKSSHQLLYYRKRKISDGFTGNVITGPDPLGMSGCGIWCIPDFVTRDGQMNYFPTGILIEYDKNECAFIGTRINVISEILRQRFDVPITASRNVNFKINNPVLVPFPATNSNGLI